MNSSFCNVIFVTEPDGAFQSAGQSWLTIDAEEIAEYLRTAGWPVKVVPVDRLLDEAFVPGTIAFYTSAYDPALRAYIREVMNFAKKRMMIAPSYDLLLAHENKGVQELLRKSIGFGGA